jgi:hypothetical protein
MAKITWNDKTTLNPQPSIARENKCTDADLNEIKQVVNTNDDNVGDLADLNTTDKTSVVNAVNELATGWTLLGSQSNSTPISLPSDYNEIMIIVETTDTARNWNFGTFCKAYIDNLSQQKAFRSGHYNSGSDTSGCAVWIRTNNVELAGASINGSGATATMYVYYK